MMVNELTDRIISIFGAERIISFLYFGSNAFKVNNHKFSDYDFLLLLDKYNDLDLFDIRKILSSKIFKGLDMNLNIIYQTDLEKRGIKNFQLRSLGPSFYKYLECSIVLVGINYFKENIIYFSKKKLSEFMDFKIQEYYGRCDKLFLQERSINKLRIKIQKYSREILRMMLIRENKISIQEIQSRSYQELYQLAINSKYITSKTSHLIESDNLFDIEVARRNIYSKYLELYSS